MEFEGYSYRVSARFGSRVKVSIDNDTVSVTGPRIGITTYRLWIAAQVILLFTLISFLIAALVMWSWRNLIIGLLATLAYWNVGTFGAVGFWELENLKAFGEGKMGQTASFPKAAIKGVKIGRGWARNGLWLVILPYVSGLNKISEGVCVSFEALDGVTHGDSVYAFHMRNQEEARELAMLLQKK